MTIIYSIKSKQTTIGMHCLPLVLWLNTTGYIILKNTYYLMCNLLDQPFKA